MAEAGPRLGNGRGREFELLAASFFRFYPEGGRAGAWRASVAEAARNEFHPHQRRSTPC